MKTKFSVAASCTCAALLIQTASLRVEGFTAPTSSVHTVHRVAHRSQHSALKKLRSSLQQTSAVIEEIDVPVVNGNDKLTDNISATTLEANLKDETFTWTKQWYPVLPASYLQDDKPTQISVLGQNLVIWKAAADNDDAEEPKISVLEDSCPHRRAPLSTGKIVGDQLACRYHGWQFDVSGTCTKIPMDAEQKRANKFCTKSYHAQVKGGLLWIFMDPEVTVPPALRKDIVNDESNSAGWMMYTSPVSFLSQIENSFDPTHAPFTHEGSGFGAIKYSPDNAIPMERYELTEPLTQDGFALEHTPYLKSPPGMEEITTTREYVPPCTSVTKNPFFSANLHFIPSKPGETIVIGQFSTGGASKKKNILSRLVPHRLKDALKDFIHFWSQVNDSHYRFLMQDQINMAGQDVRKANDQKWDDMTPTSSDAGVKAFQRWIRRYGKSGPFPLAELSSHAGKELSMWESHGKFCQQCQATIKRLARAQKVMNNVSKLSMALSVAGAAASYLLPLAQRNIRSPIGLLSFSFLILSVASRSLSQFCTSSMEKSFVTRESNVHLQTMEIYPH